MHLLKRLFIIINWICALLLFSATLAGSVNPHTFIGFSFLSYIYFPLLLINVAFVICWLCMGSKQFLISAIAIVLRWGLVTSFFQVGGKDNAPTDNVRDLRVMSFNMHHFYGPYYVDNTEEIMNQEERAHAFLSLLREMQPDVMCLQEFLPYTNGHEVDVRDSLKEMGYRYYAAAAPQYGHSASILWSRYPIVSTQLIDTTCKVRADVALGGDTLRIFSVHLNSYKLTNDDHQELEQITRGEGDKESSRQVLRKFRKTILAHADEWDVLSPLIQESPYPVIVAGDFNDTPASYIYRRISSTLKDCYREHGKGFGTTYHGKFPAFRIDYIFHDEQLNSLSYKRIISDISDHYMIVADLELK